MTTTTLPRTHVSDGCLAAYEALATLVEGLNDKQWNATARCTGWQTRDVAGHVIGLAEDTAAGVPGTRNAEEEAASVRHESPAGAAARLRAAAGSIGALLGAIDDDAWNGPIGLPDLTLGEGVLTLWFDTFIHTDDIRAAIGQDSNSGSLGLRSAALRPHAERGPGLDASIAYLAGQLTAKGWGPATLVLDGVERYEIGGGGPEITGDAMQFALVATGRVPAATMGLDPDVSIY